MFDVALKSASTAIPQTSGKESQVKQDVTAARAEGTGKAIPQNGKDQPAKDKTSVVDGNAKAAEAIKSRSDDDLAAVAKGRTEISEASTDTDAAQQERVSQEVQSKESVSKETASENPSVTGVEPDQLAESEVAAEDSELVLTEQELSQLLKDLKTGDLSSEDFLAKLEKALNSEGIDFSDIRDYLDESGLLTSAEFDELLTDPEAFLAQIQQLLQSNSELANQFKELGLSADVMARITAALNSRMQQEATPRFADVLRNESMTHKTDNLVSQLLQEQGAGKDAEAGFDKDKLFEQLLAHKAADSSSKVSGFSGLLLKEGGAASQGLSSAIAGANIGAASGAEGLQSLAQRAGLNAPGQNLPQLPVLRGLPGQPGATEALNERIMMMRSKGIQTAEIRLDPPDLGSLEVRVRVSGDTTTIQFHSPNPSVREALEAQVNRLREMMEESGLNLGQVDVSDQSLSDSSDGSFAEGRGSASGSGSGDDGSDSELAAQNSSVQQSGLGLVDYFA
ncbi:MAG: flagellar hook-length control protein FliK [Oceanospirillum sp.]|nr:flagellar hook-length control protein FliK [Oceanospirillum sp.]